MKHVIEVPAGHTVQISRHGNRVTVESAESTNQLSPVGGLKLAGDSTTAEEVINAVDEMLGFNDLAPGDVVTFKTLTGSEWRTAFAVRGTYIGYTVSLTDDRQLRLGSDCLVPCKCRKATPAEREEFLNNLRDWYSLTITETGELVNWQAESGCRYTYVSGKSLEELETQNSSYDDELYAQGNYFPRRFLTDDRLTEYKATVQKLFNKWRGLCPE